MYQMSFLETASSSTVRWIRPSSWPNHCCPAMRSAPLASNTVHPSRSSRLASRRRNDVLPTRASPLARSERAGALREAASAAFSASCQGSGSIRVSRPLGLDQKRPKEVRNSRSTLTRWCLSSCSARAIAERMIDALEKGLDDGVLAGRSLIEGRPEVRHVAEAFPLREMVAKERGYDDIFAPPILGADNRRTNGRPWID